MISKYPVVFVHGIRLSGACWNQQARLLDTRIVAAPDLPGHGIRRGELFTTDAAIEAVVEAIDDVGGRAVLVGHSLGGYVAIATAARHPDRVASLVGVGCTLVPQAWLRGAFRLAYYAMTATTGDAADISARVLRRALPAEIAEPVIAAGIATEVIPAVMDATVLIDPVAALSRYPGKTLLVNGRLDHFRLGERRFLAACRDGALQIVPGAGHYLPLTRGDTCARIIDNAALCADATE